MPDPTPVPDLTRPRRVHVIGAGGAGMSAIATVLAEMGHTVSGSDLKATAALERLEALGVRVHVGHDAVNVDGDVELVTRSTAVADTNPEVVAAAGRGIDVWSRADVLAALCATRRTIAVAGTHGKTTTSSMLALVLRDAGMEPSFIIGGELNEIGSGAAWSAGEWFVVEADESDGTFLRLANEIGVVTSVEPDHVEHYGSVDAMSEAFTRFARGARRAVVCADDAGAAALAADPAVKAVTYGLDPAADVRLVPEERAGASVAGEVHVDGGAVGRLDLAVPGRHNARNALGALAVALELGVDATTALQSLARFTGVARRFEVRGSHGGVTFVDDYAHLPTEVRETIAAARAGWRRVVCVFQPHRFSRTASLWRDFAGAFDGVDHLVVTDIYPAGEAPRPGISGRLVAEAAGQGTNPPPITYVGRRADLTATVDDVVGTEEGTVCLTLGAGDLTTLPDELLRRRAEGS